MDRSRGGLAARLVAALPETRAEQEPHSVRAHHDSCSQQRLPMATQALLFTASKAKAAATRPKRGCAHSASGPSVLSRLNNGVPSPWSQIAGDGRGMPKDSMQASRDSIMVVLRKVPYYMA